MVKKIFLNLILIIILFAQTVSAIPPDVLFIDEEIVDTSELDITAKEKLFLNLGMINGTETDYNKNNLIKYTAFLDMVKVIMNSSETDYKKLYADLYNENYVKNPSIPKNLSLNDLLYTMEKIAGYGIVAEYYGGYPEGFLAVADEYEILDNLNIDDEKNLTYGETVSIVFNILDMPVIKASGIPGTNVEFVDGKSILEGKFDIYHTRGVLTASGITTLYGNADLAENEVEIDRIKYSCEDTEIKKYLGYNLDLFVRENDYEELEIMAFAPYRNEVINISENDEILWNENGVELVTEQGKSKKISLNDAPVIHNGLLKGIYSSLDYGEFEKCSDVTFIDNNRDSEIDVVMLWEYESLRVLKTGKEVLFFTHLMKYNGEQTLKTDDEDIYYEVIRNGVQVKISDINAGEVLSLAKSDKQNVYGKTYLRIVISTDVAVGKITGMSKEDDKHIVIIGDNKYIVSDNYSNVCGLEGGNPQRDDIVKLEAGKEITLYLNHEGVIADAESFDSKRQTSYLVKAWVDDTEESGFIRVFNINEEFVTYELAEKVRFYGEDTNYNSGEKVLAAVAVNSIKNEAKADGDYRQLVVYELNNNNKISKIYMPYDRQAYEPGTVNYPNTLDYSAELGESTTYYMGLLGYSAKMYLAPWEMKMYIVPPYEEKNDTEAYMVRTQDHYGQSDIRLPHIELYNVDRFYEASISVSISKTEDKPSEALSSAIIADVSEIYDEKNGGAGLEIVCFQDGVEKKYIIPSKVECSTNDYIANVKTTELKVGDVVQFLRDDEYITSIRVIKRLSELGNSFSNDWQGAPRDILRLLYGQVAETSDKIHIVKLGDGKNYPVQFYQYSSSKKVSAYLFENGRVESIDFDEIRSGDKAFYVNNYGWTYAVYIIR